MSLQGVFMIKGFVACTTLKLVNWTKYKSCSMGFSLVSLQIILSSETLEATVARKSLLLFGHNNYRDDRYGLVLGLSDDGWVGIDVLLIIRIFTSILLRKESRRRKKIYIYKKWIRYNKRYNTQTRYTRLNQDLIHKSVILNLVLFSFRQNSTLNSTRM